MKNKTENQDLWYFSSSASYCKNFTTVLKCADSNFFSAFQLILKHSTDTRTIMLPAKNSPSCNPTQPKPRGHPRRWTFQDEYLWVVKNKINCGKSQSFPLSCRPCEREVRKDPPAGLHQQEAMGKDASSPRQQTLAHDLAASPENGQREEAQVWIQSTHSFPVQTHPFHNAKNCTFHCCTQNIRKNLERWWIWILILIPRLLPSTFCKQSRPQTAPKRWPASTTHYLPHHNQSLEAAVLALNTQYPPCNAARTLSRGCFAFNSTSPSRSLAPPCTTKALSLPQFPQHRSRKLLNRLLF